MSLLNHTKTKILVIEDDPIISEFLRTGLNYEGYAVETVPLGKKGLDIIRGQNVSLIILDLKLPDVDGFELCRRIRELGFELPVLMLTVKKEISDRVKGLDAGADDYLTKPFSFEELLARIRALLRRAGIVQDHSVLKAGNIKMVLDSRQVFIGHKEVDFTPTEFRILELLMRHPRKVFTRQTMLNRVLGYEYDGGTNIIDVHVSHIRTKLKDRPPKLIRTIYGVGYALYPDGQEEDTLDS